MFTSASASEPVGSLSGTSGIQAKSLEAGQKISEALSRHQRVHTATRNTIEATQASSTIKSEDFEGAFPNDWQLFDNNGATGGNVYWSKDAFRANGGTYSAWAAGGGADGVTGGSDYPADMNAWMVYGPFDLSDAAAATLDFSLWLDTESNADFIWWMASSNGSNFDGYGLSGSSGGWVPVQFDLAEESMLGESNVWITFIMQSDASGSGGGAYIDDIVISKEPLEPDIDVWPSHITIENASPETAQSDSILTAPLSVAQQERKIDAAAELLPLVRARGSTNVIVGLNMPFQPEGKVAPGARRSQRADISAMQQSLSNELAGFGATDKRRFRTIPFVAMNISEPALLALVQSPLVKSIEPDRLAAPVMSSSNPVIGSPLAWAEGWDGTGYANAVLDTGVDSSHPWLSGKVVSEACYSTNVEGVAESLCPGGVESSTATNSGLHCTGVDGCDHGTHVAGTIAGNDGIGPGYGVARDSDVIAMQVFSKFLTEDDCGVGESPCVLTYTSDQIAALERVLELSATLDIASANMSLGGGDYTDQSLCDLDNPSRKAAIDNLLSVGIPTVISSGNDGFINAIGAPGCISTAISVGATTDADQVASFSNIASFIDLLAPGVSINSSVPGGGTGNKQGTSMAAPHVAGAFAVLKEHSPGATVTELVDTLVTTGTPVDDNRGGGIETNMPRINLYQAIQVMESPDGTIFIRNLGSSDLDITSIAPDVSSPWLSFNPVTPFSVFPGQLKTVELAVDFSSAPSGTTVRNLTIESSDPDESPYPGGVELTVINSKTCHMTNVSDVTIDSTVSYEACESLVVGSTFTAESTAEVRLSAGSEIELLPDFNINVGATMEMQVCGKSLCSTHEDPMPLDCHPCIDQICATYPECCDTAFDQACLDRVETVCGLMCEVVP